TPDQDHRTGAGWPLVIAERSSSTPEPPSSLLPPPGGGRSGVLGRSLLQLSWFPSVRDPTIAIEIWDLATESFPTGYEFGLHRADCLVGREQRCQPRLGRWECGTKTPSTVAAQEVVWARCGFRRRRRRWGPLDGQG
ncbi:hypothetical protein U1Q18_002471, partial [Sarracenia purpurea var. burkii]